MAIFERATPESCGVDSGSIQQFIQQLKETCPSQETHHFMLVCHGKVISEATWAPYHTGARHALYSVSKAFTSTAIGFLVSEGKLAVSDKMLDYFPEYRDIAAPGTADLTVRHLLCMATGQTTDSQVHVVNQQQKNSNDQLEKFFATPCSIQPGSKFHYDGAASYALSRLVTKISGQQLDEYLQQRLFNKLGIRPPFFERCPEGYCLGYSGMMISIEEMAALGQFYLQKGNCKGEQILPESWIEEASSRQIGTEDVITGPDWNQGYCYHFWRGRHNTARFCGAHGQMCVIMPQFDALFLVQSAFDNDQLYHILDVFYSTIFQAFSPDSLPENKAAADQLKETLSALRLPEQHKPLEDWERL